MSSSAASGWVLAVDLGTSGLKVGAVAETGQILAFNGYRQPIALWNLTGVWPVKYTGPSFNTTTNGVASESLEISHTGFTFIKPPP